MMLRERHPGRGWRLWGLVLLLILGATALALARRAAEPPPGYRPASVEPAPLTLTDLRAA